MKLFINNIRIRIHEPETTDALQSIETLTVKQMQTFTLSKTANRYAVGNAEAFMLLLNAIRSSKQLKISEISITVPDKKEAKQALKTNYKLVKAAGGIVIKNGKILVINRLKTWDLPKGKIEDGEPASECAVREIEEECGVQACITEKLVSTWHTYSEKERATIKKTTWYLLQCVNDEGMSPQKEEGIDEIRWVKPTEAATLFKNSYASIQYVFKQYQKLLS